MGVGERFWWVYESCLFYFDSIIIRRIIIVYLY